MRRINVALLQTVVALTVFTFLFVQLASCGGGSSGDRSSVDREIPVASEPLTLSHSRIAPLHLLTIEHPSIEADQEIVVTFDDGNGFRVSAPAAFASAGAAQIPTPPYLYLSSDETVRSGGNVTVSIQTSDAAAALLIDPLPDVSAFNPGELTASFLELGIGNVQEIIAVLAQHSSLSDSHAAQLTYSMQATVIALQGMRDQFQSGAPVFEFEGERVSLSTAEIALLDQIYLAVMNGLFQFAIEHEVIAPGSIQTMEDLPRGSLHDWRKLVDNISNDATRGGDALDGHLGMVVLVGAGAVVGGAAGELPGIPLGAGSGLAFGGMALMVASGTVVYSEGAKRHLDTVEGDGWRSAQLTDALFDRVWETFHAVGHTLQDDATEGWKRSAFTIAQLKQNLRSALGIIDRDRWPNLPRVQDIFPLGMTVVSAPSELVVGESGIWSVLLGGGIPPYTAVYTYGDGTTQSETGWHSHYVLSHQYASIHPDDTTFTVSIVATDVVSSRVARDLPVRVLEGLTARWIENPGSLGMGEAGTWSVGISGGTPPYTATFDWGDGTSYTVDLDAAAVATATHAYDAAHTYNSLVEIQDGRAASIQLTASVEVVGSPGAIEVVSVDGMATLSVPVGAAPAGHRFTITDSTESAALVSAGRVYDIQPSGTQFATPVTLAITLPFEPEDIWDEMRGEDLSIARLVDDRWIPLETTYDSVSNTLSVQITHLSEFGIAPGPPRVPYLVDDHHPYWLWADRWRGHIWTQWTAYAQNLLMPWAPELFEVRMSFVGDLLGMSHPVIFTNRTLAHHWFGGQHDGTINWGLDPSVRGFAKHQKTQSPAPDHSCAGTTVSTIASLEAPNRSDGFAGYNLFGGSNLEITLAESLSGGTYMISVFPDEDAFLPAWMEVTCFENTSSLFEEPRQYILAEQPTRVEVDWVVDTGDPGYALPSSRQDLIDEHDRPTVYPVQEDWGHWTLIPEHDRPAWREEFLKHLQERGDYHVRHSFWEQIDQKCSDGWVDDKKKKIPKIACRAATNELRGGAERVARWADDCERIQTLILDEQVAPFLRTTRLYDGDIVDGPVPFCKFAHRFLLSFIPRDALEHPYYLSGFHDRLPYELKVLYPLDALELLWPTRWLPGY